MANKEKRIMMSFDTINQGKETDASKAGKTKKGDTKSNPPKGKLGKDIKQPVDNKKVTKGKNTPTSKGVEVTQEKKKPVFTKGGKTVKKK